MKRKFIDNREANWIIWIKAMRPRTIVASICPILIAWTFAAVNGYFQWIPAIVCLIFGVLTHITTNYANEYYDFIKGSDNDERQGPRRAVAAGLIPPITMLKVTITIIIAAFLIGCILIYYSGWWVLIVGICSLLAAVLYTAGPFAFAYKGLGDIFVILFFGLVAINATYYVLAKQLSLDVFGVSIAIGLVINNILVAANYRDAEQDKKVGKMTLIARFGLKFGFWQYRLSLISAYLILAFLVAKGNTPGLLLPFIILHKGMKLSHQLQESKTLQDHLSNLAQSSLFLVLFSGLIIIGLLIGQLLP